jgi:hypothetical protein
MEKFFQIHKRVFLSQEHQQILIQINKEKQVE